MKVNYTMKLSIFNLIVLGLSFFILGVFTTLIVFNFKTDGSQPATSANAQNSSYWLVLHRKSNIEYLYKGTPGDESKSELIRTFQVKTGIPGERPTPLPHLLEKKYWVIIGKMEQRDNLETAPYFLTLNVPVSESEPYGPYPYIECPPSPGEAGSGQCSWVLPGAFGLHGVNGNVSKLSRDDPGSSGCIRHSDEDITYLYNVLDPIKEEIRYYIYDI